jgi:hypothetical protein
MIRRVAAATFDRAGPRSTGLKGYSGSRRCLPVHEHVASKDNRNDQSDDSQRHVSKLFPCFHPVVLVDATTTESDTVGAPMALVCVAVYDLGALDHAATMLTFRHADLPIGESFPRSRLLPKRLLALKPESQREKIKSRRGQAIEGLDHAGLLFDGAPGIAELPFA